MNTADYLLNNKDNQRVALITQKEEFSYGDIRSATVCLQAEFLSLGIKSKDRIGILASNSLFWVASYLATMRIGAIAVPFATTLTEEEFLRNNSCVDCSILCIEQRLFRKFAPIIPPAIKVVFDDLRQKDVAYPEISSASVFDDTEDAAYMFTSGTTAYPRVVRITHRNIQANTDSIIRSLSLTSSERILAILPFYYCFGTSLLHTHLKIGGSIVISGALLYPESTLNLMESTDCTGLAGVPSIYQTFLRNTTFPKRKLPKLSKIQQAGGKLSNILIKELIDCRPRSEIFVMYGQTEATARLSCMDPNLATIKLGSIGKGLPGVELKVLNEKGDPVQSGEVGEIVAKGENISPGYLNDPEANAEKFVDGTLRTGDLATVDEDGYIYIVDRKSDFIKSYGNRVSSQQVEACVLELKDVVSAAAIGVPDLIRGEAIRVFVTLRSGSQILPEEIIEYCKSRMSPHMVPKEVIVIKKMPTNAHGKITKSELKTWQPENTSESNESNRNEILKSKHLDGVIE